MGKDKDIVYEILLEPCYIVYEREKYTSLMRLHTLWQDYNNAWNSNDVAGVVNAWHGIMAIVQIFRERREWDEDRGEPKPFFRVTETPKHQIKCPNCHCNCRWDDEAYDLWDGLCPACGVVLDVLRTKEAV